MTTQQHSYSQTFSITAGWPTTTPRAFALEFFFCNFPFLAARSASSFSCCHARKARVVVSMFSNAPARSRRLRSRAMASRLRKPSALVRSTSFQISITSAQAASSLASMALSASGESARMSFSPWMMRALRMKAVG